MTETSEPAPATSGPAPATETTVPPMPAGHAENAAAPGPPQYPPDSSGNRVVWVAGLLLLILLLALLLAFLGSFRHWFALHTGTLHGGPDVYYNFWSGFGSDLGEATLISAVCLGVYTGVRKVNCHTKGCWRIGHHPLEGTPFILCKHHHPHVPNHGATHDEILAQHRRFRERSAAKNA